MIKCKLIKKNDKYSEFITEENKKIYTIPLSSLQCGETYFFQNDMLGFSIIADTLGNKFNILIIES